jgi:GxxExxY protein
MNGMQMDGGDARLLEPVTERIIGCAFRVANALGHGFVEKVYENALAHEMRKCGIGVVQQRGVVVFYDDVIVGEYAADLLVEDQVIVELKVVSALSDVPVPQCRNYLRATGKPPWQVQVPADQLRPAQSRNPPRHRPSLNARTIPFIPAIPFIRLKKMNLGDAQE